MFSISPLQLKRFCALIWISGGVVLLAKSCALFNAAKDIDPNSLSLASAIGAGIVIGLLKMRFIFSTSCQRNLNRIDALSKPKVWQVYRPGFLLFLLLMIIFGNSISTYATNKYGWLLGVAIIDLSLAIGLLGSSYLFWQNGLLRRQPNNSPTS